MDKNIEVSTAKPSKSMLLIKHHQELQSLILGQDYVMGKLQLKV
jgi:hypothetical protein